MQELKPASIALGRERLYQREKEGILSKLIN